MGEIGGKVGRREKKKRNLLGRSKKLAQKSREEGEIGSESREKGDLPPCPPPPLLGIERQKKSINTQFSPERLEAMLEH